jgi:hypothetical protein
MLEIHRLTKVCVSQTYVTIQLFQSRSTYKMASADEGPTFGVTKLPEVTHYTTARRPSELRPSELNSTFSLLDPTEVQITPQQFPVNSTWVNLPFPTVRCIFCSYPSDRFTYLTVNYENRPHIFTLGL